MTTSKQTGTREKLAELVTKWRAVPSDLRPIERGRVIIARCADELEAVLAGNEPGADVAQTNLSQEDYNNLVRDAMLWRKQAAAQPLSSQGQSVLVSKMRQLAEECLRRYEINPQYSAEILHTPDTYKDLLKLCELAAAPLVPLEPEARRLREALERIKVGQLNSGHTVCDCTHDDENCCEKVGEYCPQCIAAAALAADSPAPAGAEETQADVAKRCSNAPAPAAPQEGKS